MSINEKVLEILIKAQGQKLSAPDVIARLNGDGEHHPASISAALSHLRVNRDTTGVIRVDRGLYAYRPHDLDADTGDDMRAVATKQAMATRRKQAKAPLEASTDPSLAPILDGFDTNTFMDVGMRVVARASDGDFITLDENGVAWRVSIAITAKLL